VTYADDLDKAQSRIKKLEAALRHIGDEAYGDFYVEGNGKILETYCAEALAENVT